MNDQKLVCPYCDNDDKTIRQGFRKSEATGLVNAVRYKCKQCGKMWSEKLDSSLTTKLNSLGVDPKNVTRVKYWETASGEQRMSITEDLKQLSENSIIEQFEALLDKAPTKTLPLLHKTDRVKSGADFLLVTTDRHFGMDVGEEPLYSTAYGEEEIDQQNLHMIDSVIEASKLYGKFKTLWYADLGDALHGYNNKTVRGGHDLKSSLNNRQQFDLYVRNVWAFVNTLSRCDVAENYTFIFLVNDNHAGDFGYICARAVQLLAQVHLPHVTFKIVTKFITHEYIGGAAYIFTHGKDREHMKYNMPLTLNAKTEALLDKYMMHYKLPPGDTHVFKGDIHQPATTYGHSFRYKNVIPSTGKSEREDIIYGSTWRGYEYEVVKNKNILMTRTVIL